MYASEWIFGLFASVIPLENMSVFYSNFFENSWIFFYSLILTILKFLEKELLIEDDLWNIINQIKCSTHTNPAIASSHISPNKKRRGEEDSLEEVNYS